MALSNEDDGVDLITGHYWTNNFTLALKQWQIKRSAALSHCRMLDNQRTHAG